MSNPYTATTTPSTEFIKFNGANFKTVTWKVPENVAYKGKIIYVHGFCESLDLYIQLFDDLALQGYETFFFDQRGSGDTSPGKAYGITNESHVFNDLDYFVEYNLKLRKDPEEKFFLGGHSMGGGIVLNYGIHGKHVKDFKGIFACAPMVSLHPTSKPASIVKLVGSIVSKVAPNIKLDSGLKVANITHNVPYQEYVTANVKIQPLIGSLKLFDDMMNRGDKLLKPEYAAKWNKDTALLILHGSSDEINDFNGSKKFFGLLKDGVDKEFYASEGGRHSLFIEDEEWYKPVFAKVVSFLDGHNAGITQGGSHL